jgi:uncharacterized protein
MHIGTVAEIWRFPVKSMAGERLKRARIDTRGVEGDRGWAIRDSLKGELGGAKQWPVLLQCSALYRDACNGGVPPVDMTLPDGSRIAGDAPDVHDRLTALVGRDVTLESLRPASDKAFYRRAAPGSALLGRLGRSKTFVRATQKLMSVAGLDGELRQTFSREADEPLPDLSTMPPEILEFTSPPGTFFDLAPIHVLTTASLAAMARANPSAAWDRRRFRPNLLLETPGDLEGLVEAAWGGRTLSIGAMRLRLTIPTMRCGMTMHAQGDLPRDPTVLRSIVRDADQNLGIYASVEAAGDVAVGDAATLE